MPVVSIQGSLEAINRDLKDVQERREKLIKGTRDAVMLCSKSIIAMHHGQLGEAAEMMGQAKAMLAEFRVHAGDDLYRYIALAEQELVEAYVLRAVMEGQSQQLPSMADLEVSGPSYLTGLLDCVGEIKRLVYDRMRSGNEKDAESLFAVMEDIYGAVYPFAVYDNIVAGLRKKLDVARMLIEDIRAVVTEEKRRKAMVDAIGGLEKRLLGGNI
ncbi:translin family protein [Nitrososphaera viennensis]|uniref:RNA-binding protein n=2 Tax=Nitrososphaera viennensis TaxID=1034015 RepID=A0A977IG56_9ARCH|nr:RNA-binding protein [Nitrososphaera viennensis]AIC15458.1 putative translin family protein [Nitrososphaera viennensis EN76]UVS70348.1 RNA-binding protein [Nitrososphaera viennensis]